MPLPASSVAAGRPGAGNPRGADVPYRTGSLGGLVAIAVLAAAAALTWLGAAPAAGQEGSPPPTGAVDRGALLYAQNCATCHGGRGEGGPNGPSLHGVGAASVDFYLRTGRMPLSAPDAPGFRQEPAFVDADVAALVEYTRRWSQGGPEIPAVVVDGADLRRGAELYLQNCAACHAATGAGNAVGGGNVAYGLGNATNLQVAEAMLIGPGVMPRFAFDDTDRDAILAYVEFLRNAPAPGGTPIGGFGPVAEGFVAVVIGLTLLVLVARFVGRRSPEGEPDVPGPGEPGPAS